MIILMLINLFVKLLVIIGTLAIVFLDMEVIFLAVLLIEFSLFFGGELLS